MYLLSKKICRSGFCIFFLSELNLLITEFIPINVSKNNTVMAQLSVESAHSTVVIPFLE